jgi:transcriptional regulator with XRE-family HTH domain
MFKIITEQEIVTKEVNEVEVSLLGYIGYRVKQTREDADINISQLSRRLKNHGHPISDSTIGKIERGDCPLKIEDLNAIANFFEVKMSTFFPEGVL